MSKLQLLVGKARLGAKKNAPELLLGGALITGTACIASTVFATTKAQSVRNNLASDKAQLTIEIESDSISKEDTKKAVRKIYTDATLGYVKHYAVPTALFVATTGLVFASYKIQKNRQIALSSALASTTLAYSTLLGRLKNGANHGLTAKEVLDGVEVVQKVDAETGEVTYEKTQGDKIGSIYEFRFDKYSSCWEVDKFQNLCTLNSEMQWANNLLQLRGYVFLNEVLNRLGLPSTHAGQIVGWKLGGNGDGYIDFGITDCEELESVGFDRNAFDLNFNVDGDILTDFE